ncbi:MAG: UbiD family decarboxylase [Deltaproteobacteria bacterium]|nr:UbiD family decarboxylase [Deltaproteobacteria bacterium]
MKEDFRTLLGRLEKEGELRRITKEVDGRHTASLLAQSKQALLFERIKGFDMAAAGAVISTRRRLALSMGCPEREIGARFEEGIARPIPPKLVSDGACQEVVYKGEDVDLTMLPLPILHEKDGGPYISAGVVVANDPAYGRNMGSYRMMYRTPRETGIDLVSPSDLRVYYQKAFEQKQPLPIAVAIGLHPYEMLAASYKAPIRMDEFAIAGGLHGNPVELVRCRTVDLEVPADAEIVLEGELLPIGWTEDEGRFGEFSHIQGDVKWNPVFRVRCITTRRDPIFYILQMPWENDWLAGPVIEAAALRILREASVEPVAVYATPGSCCYWELIASIRKRPGEGKNAVLALLALAEVKLVIVTDDDINIYDPHELDWALTFRVQADRDVIIVSGARGKLKLEEYL